MLLPWVYYLIGKTMGDSTVVRFTTAPSCWGNCGSQNCAFPQKEFPRNYRTQKVNAVVLILLLTLLFDKWYNRYIRYITLFDSY